MSIVRMDPDAWGLALAQVVALRSSCVRRQVGAVLIKDGRILSGGVNGPAAGLPHRTECVGPNQCVRIGMVSGSNPSTVCCAHAEANAIQFANRADSRGSTLYCTDSPCSSCADAIINAGVIRVVCGKVYADPVGLEKLHYLNITVVIRGDS